MQEPYIPQTKWLRNKVHSNEKKSYNFMLYNVVYSILIHIKIKMTWMNERTKDINHSLCTLRTTPYTVHLFHGFDFGVKASGWISSSESKLTHIACGYTLTLSYWKTEYIHWAYWISNRKLVEIHHKLHATTVPATATPPLMRIQLPISITRKSIKGQNEMSIEWNSWMHILKSPW